MDNMPRAYEVNGTTVSAPEFTRKACDPRRSVVVEACAGSGKTWLLVARMLRLLLAGAEPAELLAITFTRKAAQEMRERLIQLLHDLALQPDAEVETLLLERGVPVQEIPALLPAARRLYERVLASPQPLSIDTFHSWFARLLQIAPLASGVPHGYTLAESTGELLADAYGRLMQALNGERYREIREALLSLYDMVGDWNAGRLLDAFVSKRAEWWAANHGMTDAAESAPLQWLQQLCGEDAEYDARLTLWDDSAMCGRIQQIACLLGRGAKRNQERAVMIESSLTGGPDEACFAQLLAQFWDDKGDLRKNDHRRGKLLAVLEQHLGGDGADRFEEEFAAIGQYLLQLQRRSAEPMMLALNRALFVVGVAYLERYQAIKTEQRILDFSDLEWHAYRLLTDENHAAYLHSRLDARYRHILLDEFQDTNPLQWSIVRAWLKAYGDDTQKPSVFIVGDPKQSIYRFRRAEPRVFAAARDMLATQGADILRTNQTRRNAVAIVQVMNASFAANPIFSAQTTLVEQGGEVWRLPLAENEQIEQDEQKTSSLLVLRDPLTMPRLEEEDVRRLKEGRLVALAIRQAKESLATRLGRMPVWSDVMLLVKKRAYLTAYESALREAGIPFVSDKRGGLLESLEVADLIALLTFLITPADNLALAHVLKSPIVGASDDDLIALAQRGDSAWWPRLQLAARDGASEAIKRATFLLEEWLEAAPRLPVHDLLDLILHRGQLIARYARVTPSLLREQAVGNIEAFTALALNLDAGRYPSLPKFIEALRVLKKEAESDAPDEARINASANAVRILTIHSAKGLEAPIVVVLDANHSEPARDDLGILCEWPQDADAPTHFSAFGRYQERGAARDAFFAAEEGFRQQEDWNLLYVAATRARHILIISGVAGGRGTLPNGIVDGSWYHRLQSAVPECVLNNSQETATSLEELVSEGQFTIPIFDPPVLENLHVRGDATAYAGSRKGAIEEGIALHAVLEWLTQSASWPVRVPDIDALAHWLSCSRTRAAIVRQQALTILTQSHLEKFFNPAQYRFAQNEMDVIVNGDLLRFDRVVVFDEEAWVLDYKRDVLDSEYVAYREQLAAYRQAAEAVFPDKTIRAGLITVDGRLWDMG